MSRWSFSLFHQSKLIWFDGFFVMIYCNSLKTSMPSTQFLFQQQQHLGQIFGTSIMYLSPHSVAYATIWKCSEGMVLFRVIPFCGPLCPCFVVHCFLSLIVLQSSLWGRESWSLYFVCILVSCDCYGCGWSLRCCWCDCGISWSCSHDFYSCVALSQQAESHYFLYNLCFFLKFSKKECQNSTR